MILYLLPNPSPVALHVLSSAFPVAQALCVVELACMSLSECIAHFFSFDIISVPYFSRARLGVSQCFGMLYEYNYVMACEYFVDSLRYPFANL